MTVVEQQKVMNEQVQIIDELRRDLDAAQSTLKRKVAELADTREKLEKCMQKLRESRGKIKED